MKKYIKASTELADFDSIIKQYMPDYGEGDTQASQMATAMNRLFYRWYNSGDVFDNHWYTELYLGWANDLSSEGNWIYGHCPNEARPVMNSVRKVRNEADYEKLLYKLGTICLDPSFLETLSTREKDGSIYNSWDDGPFFVEEAEDDEEDW